MPEEYTKSSPNLSSTDKNEISYPNDHKLPQGKLPNQPPNHHRRKIISIFGIIIILVIIICVCLYLYSNLQKDSSYLNIEINPKPTSLVSQNSELENDNTFEVPELYPEVDWNEFTQSENEKSLGQNALYFEKGIYEPIEMGGQEWIASMENLSNEEMHNLISNFNQYYQTELERRSWSNKYEDEHYGFIPIAADGTMGSIWGYLKAKNGKIRVIALEHRQPPESASNSLKCPCDVKFKVFVSEIESMEDLAEGIK
jgi:hypothetical protein